MKSIQSFIILGLLAINIPVQASFIQGTYNENYDPEAGTEFFTITHPEDIRMFGNQDLQYLCYFGPKKQVTHIINEMVRVAIQHGDDEFYMGDATVRSISGNSLEVEYTYASDYDSGSDLFRLSPCDLEKSIQEKRFAARMFQQSQSESLRYNEFSKIEPNQWVSYVEPKPNQTTSYTTIFVGKKKSDLTNPEFFTKLYSHIRSVQKSFVALGMNTYRVYAVEGYEIAIQSWGSKEAFEKASKNPIAQAAFKEAQALMQPLLFQEIK